MINDGNQFAFTKTSPNQATNASLLSLAMFFVKLPGSVAGKDSLCYMSLMNHFWIIYKKQYFLLVYFRIKSTTGLMHAVTGCTEQCALFLIGFITNSEGKEKQKGKVPKLLYLCGFHPFLQNVILFSTKQMNSQTLTKSNKDRQTDRVHSIVSLIESNLLTLIRLFGSTGSSLLNNLMFYGILHNNLIYNMRTYFSRCTIQNRISEGKKKKNVIIDIADIFSHTFLTPHSCIDAFTSAAHTSMCSYPVPTHQCQNTHAQSPFNGTSTQSKKLYSNYLKTWQTTFVYIR